jgi:hypothetical protein
VADKDKPSVTAPSESADIPISQNGNRPAEKPVLFHGVDIHKLTVFRQMPYQSLLPALPLDKRLTIRSRTLNGGPTKKEVQPSVKRSSGPLAPLTISISSGIILRLLSRWISRPPMRSNQSKNLTLQPPRTAGLMAPSLQFPNCFFFSLGSRLVTRSTTAKSPPYTGSIWQSQSLARLGVLCGPQ